MPHPLDDSHLFDLAHGLVPAAEQPALVAHLRQCGQCEQRFRVLVREREKLRSDDKRRLWGEGAPRPARARWKPIAWTSAVAAAGVAAVLVVTRFGGQETRPVYWMPVDQEATVFRSAEEETGHSVVGGALDAYQRHDAEAAIVQLQEFTWSPDNKPAATLRDLFLASALVNAGRYSEAEGALARLGIDTMPTQWRRQAQWVRYLALSQLQRDREAREILQILVNEPGEIGRLAREEAERL